jgi:Uma2 family endonuclease
MAVQVAVRGEEHTVTSIPFEVRRLTVDDYHRLIDLGFFAPNERVELLQGFLHPMSPQNPPHLASLSVLHELLGACIGKQGMIRTQGPITIQADNSEPEPDLVVAKRQPQNYFDRHPYPDDVLLLVEVSASTLKKDQEAKARVYAAARIEDYWIMNLIDDWLEVYRDPVTFADGTSTYLTRMTFLPGQTVSPLRFPECRIEVNQVLGVTFEEPTDE